MSAALPFGRDVLARLPFFFFGPQKITAEQTAAALPSRLYFAPQNDPRRDARCGAMARAIGWDYVCTFVPRPEVSQKRLKVGVRVGPNAITEVSHPYELDTPQLR